MGLFISFSHSWIDFVCISEICISLVPRSKTSSSYALIASDRFLIPLAASLIAAVKVDES